MIIYNCKGKRKKKEPQKKGSKKMNTTEIIAEVIVMDITNKIISKVEGNRNWVIKTEVYDGKKVAICNRFGELKRRGHMVELLKTIAKYHIRWYEFTYKKDYMKAIEILKNNGYEITH